MNKQHAGGARAASEILLMSYNTGCRTCVQSVRLMSEYDARTLLAREVRRRPVVEHRLKNAARIYVKVLNRLGCR